MFQYDNQLILSISIRLIAFIWSVVLFVRIRNWRISLLSMMILLMSLQQSLRFISIKSEIPGFFVSILVLLVTIFVGKLILQLQSNQLRLKDLNENLEQKVLARTAELEKVNSELIEALSHVKTLRGMIPICSYCHKIRDDKESWHMLESYISDHSEAVFSHGVCPSCLDKQITIINGTT